MANGRSLINLDEPFRASAAHHLELDGNVWRAAGHNPYLVYSLADRPLAGAWLIELSIEALQGNLAPRINLEGPAGFCHELSRRMRHAEGHRYKLSFAGVSPVTAIRFDPGEDCTSFRILTFTARPLTHVAFLFRTLRRGANRGDEPSDLRRLLPLGLGLIRDRVVFDSGQRPVNTERSSLGRRMAAELGASTPQAVAFQQWIDTWDYAPRDREAVARKVMRLTKRPLISVLLPVYNTPPSLLDVAIASVAAQIYPNWELCIADDASTNPETHATIELWLRRDRRLRAVFRTENGHIARATNSALDIARGTWITCFDHDDIMREHALAEAAFAMAEHPQARVIYSDEDKISLRGERYEPYFKCDWNEDLFLSQNYLNHLTLLRTDDVRAVSGMRPGFEGSEDHDLFLRIVEKLDPCAIVHIPKILYHWRAAPGSTARAPSEKPYIRDGGIRLLADYSHRLGLEAEPMSVPGTPYYRLRRAVPEPAPLVSLIIPTRDRAALLRTCVFSILQKTSYRPFEIIIADNDSREPDALAYLTALTELDNVIIHRCPGPFNYSTINNEVTRIASGELLAFINNDIEVISPDWLTEMVSQALRPEVGCVGAKLYYPNDTVQHGGIILGIGGVAGIAHKYAQRSSSGYFGRLAAVQQFSAVTAACMVMRKSVFMEAGGFDTEHLAVAFNDVDLCLRVAARGYRNIWTPFAELYHHESLSRGADTTPENRSRFSREAAYMRWRWGALLDADPFYSPHLSRAREDFSIEVDG